MVSNLRVDTNLYETRYGKRPRGIDAWYFQFMINGHWTEPIHMGVGGSYYSAAKALALRRAKLANATAVRLAP